MTHWIQYAEEAYTLGTVYEAQCACGWIGTPQVHKGVSVIEAERHMEKVTR